MKNQAGAMRRVPVMVDGQAALASVIRNSVFDYTSTPFTFTTGLETFQQSIPIQQDGHFLCTMTEYSNSLQIGASGGLVILFGGAFVQLTDGASQRFLSNAQVPVDSKFGSGKEPYVWPLTHLFRANGFIGIQITGAGAAMAGGIIRLTFSGFKVPVGSVALPDGSVL